MQILSWNIQNGIGVDGVLSLKRIATEIRRMAEPDMICLQEVSRGLSLQAGDDAPDQIHELEQLFPEYEVIFGAAIDASAKDTETRWQFGNAVLSKVSFISIQHHILPTLATSKVRHMTRQSIEVVVTGSAGLMRVVNLHLEFHSLSQRKAQIEKLRGLQLEALMEKQNPRMSDPHGPYQAVPRPVNAIYCGDFNMLHQSEEYLEMVSPLAHEVKPFYDAWEIVHPDNAHDPTCGIFDHKSWPEGAHCRDFVFAAGDCANQVKEFVVNKSTDASDHQPLLVTL